jgi:putative endonuclease
MLKNKLAHLIKGKAAEQTAEATLKKHGLKILQRNFRTKYGEIDLIALDGNTLVFIEVRYRTSTQFGSAAETVTISKQKKIIKAAEYFLHCQPNLTKHTMRFDVIGLNAIGELDWIKGAILAT